MFHKGKSGKSYANPQVRDYEEGNMEKKTPAAEGEKPMQDGEPEENGEIPSHLEAMHGKMGGKHMHVHQGDDGKITSHQHSDMGAEGPHEHTNMDALHEHQRGFMDDGGGMAMPAMGGKNIGAY